MGEDEDAEGDEDNAEDDIYIVNNAGVTVDQVRGAGCEEANDKEWQTEAERVGEEKREGGAWSARGEADDGAERRADARRPSGGERHTEGERGRVARVEFFRLGEFMFAFEPRDAEKSHEIDAEEDDDCAANPSEPFFYIARDVMQNGI